MSIQKQTVAADIAALLKTYKPSEETVELVRRTPIVLLVGIVGAGKTTIKKELFKSDKYYDMVSHTTRQPRENAGVLEQDGVEYHFVSPEEIKQMLHNGEFVEAKLVHNTAIYGTSVNEVRTAHQQHKIILNDIDVQGVAEYKAISDNVFAMFIVPPNYEVWYDRIVKRYGNKVDYQDLRQRMQTAINELEHALEVGYYHFIINDELERAVHAIDKITHGNDIFSAKDAWARQKAVELLAVIRKNTG